MMESEISEILCSGRYRNDGLLLWCGSEKKLNYILSFLNKQSSDMKHTMKIVGNPISFLDFKKSIA